MTNRIVLQTERQTLSRIGVEDAGFILRLLNEPSFVQYIGDRGLRTLEDAEHYIRNGPMRMYEQYGFGLYLVTLLEERTPIGICGLLQRQTLPDVDVGFAYLPGYWGRGLAYEAAAAVLCHAREHLGLCRIVAITSPDNERSARLLERLGLRCEGTIRLPEYDESRLFAIERERSETALRIDWRASTGSRSATRRAAPGCSSTRAATAAGVGATWPIAATGPRPAVSTAESVRIEPKIRPPVEPPRSRIVRRCGATPSRTGPASSNLLHHGTDRAHAARLPFTKA